MSVESHSDFRKPSRDIATDVNTQEVFAIRLRIQIQQKKAVRCLKTFSRKETLRGHEKEAHSSSQLKKNHQCSKCGKRFLRKFNLTRHNKICGKKILSLKRTLTVKNKKALIRCLETEGLQNAINEAAKKFKIDRKRVMTIYGNKNEILSSKTRKSRGEGRGRKLDDWWQTLSPHVLSKFRKYREEYNLQVTSKHLLICAQEACIENGIDLQKMAEERGITKDLPKALMSRVYRFIKKNRITKRKINRANHVDEKEIGKRCASYIKNHRRLRDSLNISKLPWSALMRSEFSSPI